MDARRCGGLLGRPAGACYSRLVSGVRPVAVGACHAVNSRRTPRQICSPDSLRAPIYSRKMLTTHRIVSSIVKASNPSSSGGLGREGEDNAPNSPGAPAPSEAADASAGAGGAPQSNLEGGEASAAGAGDKAGSPEAPLGGEAASGAAGGGGGGSAQTSSGAGGGGGPGTVALARRMPGIGYTFLLAGFLKILTVAGLAQSAPQDAVRTTLGKFSQFLLIPGGLLMCWVAKYVVDNDLQYNNKFLGWMVAGLVFLYFFIYRLLFRVDISIERVRPTRPNTSSPMAEVRAKAGDRDRSGLILRDSRRYEAVKPGQMASDLAYYEGTFASDVQGEDDGGRAPGRPSAAELDARNPLRQQVRRAPGVSGAAERQRAFDDAVMRPR